MKTKLVLGILAAALSLSLAIGGTLMLFTAQSDEATNVVTLGTADIELWENDGVDDTQDGITVIDAVPNTDIPKKPFVKNVGTVPVYVYVEGVLTVTDGTDAVDLTADSLAAEQVQSILDTVGAGDLGVNWRGAATDLTYAADGIITGTYYLANDSGLVSLDAEETTNYIFEQVSIPSTVGNALSGYTITLELKAYAVQSENSNITTLEALQTTFAANKDL
jgi:predicted ribosomally synthesized peptide with SipW-like signal peptide